MSHGQNNLERGFFVNEEVLEDNLQEKSFVSECLIYDTVHSSDIKLHEFVITSELQKKLSTCLAKIPATFRWFKTTKRKNKKIYCKWKRNKSRNWNFKSNKTVL